MIFIHTSWENTFPLKSSQAQPHKEMGILIGGKIRNSEAQSIQEGKRQGGFYRIPESVGY